MYRTDHMVQTTVTLIYIFRFGMSFPARCSCTLQPTYVGIAYTGHDHESATCCGLRGPWPCMARPRVVPTATPVRGPLGGTRPCAYHVVLSRMTQDWTRHTRDCMHHTPRIPCTRARYTGASNTTIIAQLIDTHQHNIDRARLCGGVTHKRTTQQ